MSKEALLKETEGEKINNLEVKMNHWKLNKCMEMWNYLCEKTPEGRKDKWPQNVKCKYLSLKPAENNVLGNTGFSSNSWLKHPSPGGFRGFFASHPAPCQLTDLAPLVIHPVSSQHGLSSRSMGPPTLEGFDNTQASAVLQNPWREESFQFVQWRTQLTQLNWWGTRPAEMGC